MAVLITCAKSFAHVTNTTTLTGSVWGSSSVTYKHYSMNFLWDVLGQ